MHRVWLEDEGILLWLFPDAVLLIAKHNNTQLCSKLVQHFVFLDREDTRGGDSTWGVFGTEGSIFRKTYFDIGIEGLYAVFLLRETCQPGVAIRVRDTETTVSNEQGHSHMRLTALTRLANVGLLCGVRGR